MVLEFYVRLTKMFLNVVISSEELLKEEEARIVTSTCACSTSPGSGPLDSVRIFTTTIHLHTYM